MKIAFYIAQHGDIYDKAISIASTSIYSHVELVLSTGISASASLRDGGVRFKMIDYDYKWHVYKLDFLGYYDEARIVSWFDKHDHEKYDLLGAFGSALRLDWTSRDKKFCSCAVSEVLELPNPIMTPGRLHTILRRSGMPLKPLY